MTERARQGKRTCNDVLGYDLSGPDNLVINPREAKIVRYIDRTYLRYRNLSFVAEACRKKGYVGKRGRPFTPEGIRKILTRPIYCGYNSYNGQLYKGSHPPIRTVSTHNKIQRLLDVYKRQDLGDLVTADSSTLGVTIDNRVTEVQESEENGVLTITPTVGSTEPETMDLEGG